MAFKIDNPIPDEERLFRHVPKAKDDPLLYWNSKQNRPRGLAFRDKDRRASADREKHHGSAGTVLRPSTLIVVSILAGECRRCGKEAAHDPLNPEDEGGPNEAHSVICNPGGIRKSKQEEAVACDALAFASQTVWMTLGEPSFSDLSPV